MAVKNVYRNEEAARQAEPLSRKKIQEEKIYLNYLIKTNRDLTEDEKMTVACYKIGEAEREMRDIVDPTNNLKKYWCARRKVKNVEAGMVDYVFPDMVTSEADIDETVAALIKMNSGRETASPLVSSVS